MNTDVIVERARNIHGCTCQACCNIAEKELEDMKLFMDYYLKGDQQERREAGNEILRRLDALEQITSEMSQNMSVSTDIQLKYGVWNYG